jgi:hypothetical protein
MSETKTVCIVGVAGFIGSHLLEKIIRERTWNVIGIDMVSPHKIQQLLGAEKKWAARFEFHQMNIVTMPLEMKGLIARSDCVVNLAAICNPSEYIKQPVNTINSNFTDAQDCIKYCVELDKHLVHFSTCEVYGRTLASYGLTKDDPQNWLLDEETTPMIMGPVSAQRWCYACAKQLVERLIYAHGTENNLKVRPRRSATNRAATPGLPPAPGARSAHAPAHAPAPAPAPGPAPAPAPGARHAPGPAPAPAPASGPGPVPVLPPSVLPPVSTIRAAPTTARAAATRHPCCCPALRCAPPLPTPSASGPAARTAPAGHVYVS